MSTRDDYIPSNDPKMIQWIAKFLDSLDVYKDVLGVTQEEITELGDYGQEFSNAFASYTEAQRVLRRESERRKTARRVFSEKARKLVRRINGEPAMNNSIRLDMGLNAWAETRTRMEVGGDVPGIRLESRLGQVIIHLGTNPGNEGRNGKPKWARGCNIYRKFEGEEEFRMLDYCEDSPYIDEITGPAVQVSYLVRYRGRTPKDLGPQSAPASIAAGGASLKDAA